MSAEKKLTENADFPLDEQWKDANVLNVSHGSGDTFSINSIGVSEGMEADEAISLAHDNKLRYLVHSNKFDYPRELNVAAMMIHQAENLFKYPAASVFSPEDVNEDNEDKFKFIEYEFSKASEKYNALILLEVELEKISSNESLITGIRTIADELFTNAVYNAPSSAKGEKLNHKDKSVEMEGGNSGKIFLARNEKMLLIGCSDPYGSLNPEDMIERINKCYADGVSSAMNMSEMGGAGIGSFMAFNLSTSFYVGVKPGEMSLVMCAIPLHVSNRKMQKMPKNFHFLKAGEK